MSDEGPDWIEALFGNFKVECGTLKISNVGLLRSCVVIGQMLKC